MNIGWKSFLYLILSVTCISGALHPDLIQIHLWTKPALMISLIVFVLISGPWKSNLLKGTALLALVFSGIGDVLLMQEDAETVFMYGLIAFLIAHLFYIVNFLVAKPSFIEIPFLKRNPWAIFITAAYVGLMFTQLKEGAGPLSGAILGYALVLGLMLLFALNREKKVPALSFRFVTFGAVFFVISDSLLAYNKFVMEIPFSPIFILGSYALAQYLIVQGLIIEGKEN
jgi:uncharacterized membrane protein YhhN